MSGFSDIGTPPPSRPYLLAIVQATPNETKEIFIDTNTSFKLRCGVTKGIAPTKVHVKKDSMKPLLYKEFWYSRSYARQEV